MTLLKINPRSKGSVPSNFYSLLDDILKENKVDEYAKSSFVPRANIIEGEKEFQIQLELAGFNKKDIEINLEKDVLIIKGEKKNNESKNTPQYHVRQINDGNFQRSFYLPEDVAADKINARFENGILNIEIPKDEAKLIKRNINVG